MKLGEVIINYNSDDAILLKNVVHILYLVKQPQASRYDEGHRWACNSLIQQSQAK